MSHVARGTIQFQLEGQPATLLPEGSAFLEPANATVVRFDNASTDAPATFIAFYLLGAPCQSRAVPPVT